MPHHCRHGARALPLLPHGAKPQPLGDRPQLAGGAHLSPTVERQREGTRTPEDEEGAAEALAYHARAPDVQGTGQSQLDEAVEFTTDGKHWECKRHSFLHTLTRNTKDALHYLACRMLSLPALPETVRSIVLFSNIRSRCSVRWSMTNRHLCRSLLCFFVYFWCLKTQAADTWHCSLMLCGHAEPVVVCAHHTRK